MRRFLVIFVAFSIMILSSTVAWAKDPATPATPEFTFQQALDRAMVNSKALQSANYDIDRSYEVRQKVSDKVTFIPQGSYSTTEADSAFNNLLQADLNWQMNKKTLSVQEDTVVMQTYQLYDGILQAQEKVNLAEAQLRNAERQRTVADANVRVGILSKMGLIQAQAAVESANSGLGAAKKALDDAYQKFNQLVGLNPEDRPSLVDKPAFNELKIDNLDATVSRAIDASPTVWLKDQQIDLAKINLDLYNWSNQQNADPYEAKKIDVTKAEVSAGDTKDQLAKLVRTMYYNIKQYEDQYAGYLENVKVAEESLRVARVKYEAGMAIEADVISAEATLAQAKQTLVDVTCQHDILSYAFTKPWAYASSSSSK